TKSRSQNLTELFGQNTKPIGFESKKQAGFVQMSRLLEFDAPHRARKAAKYGRKPTFFERNGSRLSSFDSHVARHLSFHFLLLRSSYAIA
ncbi:MAG TPA: hypothetical protein PK971_09210, partial [Saprospiraceae bacterium]|nr:hypothetical protein [Saprospiraceae bacterium]